MPFYISITWKTLNNTVLHYWVRVINNISLKYIHVVVESFLYLEEMTNRIQDIV
jgi:hypothetical protein